MSNIKVNDIVICVDNSNSDLILNKKYKVLKITNDYNIGVNLITLYDIEQFGYFDYRFVNLKSIRKDKIKHLCDVYKQCILFKNKNVKL